MKNGRKNTSPVTDPIYKRREAITLLQVDTLGCQQKEMGHKGGHSHEICIVHTTVCQKAPVWLK